MEEVIRLAGSVTASAVATLSKGLPVSPVFKYLNKQGEHHTKRLPTQPAAATAVAAQALYFEHENKQGAVFLSDGVVKIPRGTVDALSLQLRATGRVATSISLLVPYRPIHHPQGFAVHRLIVGEVTGFNAPSVAWIANAFTDGLENAGPAYQVWRKTYEDQADNTASSYCLSDAFTIDEMAALKAAPLLVYQRITGPREVLTAKDLSILQHALLSKYLLKNPLHQGLATTLISHLPHIAMMAPKTPKEIHVELAYIATLIDRKLSQPQAYEFKKTLVSFAKHVAKLSSPALAWWPVLPHHKVHAISSVAQSIGMPNHTVECLC